MLWSFFRCPLVLSHQGKNKEEARKLRRAIPVGKWQARHSRRKQHFRTWCLRQTRHMQRDRRDGRKPLNPFLSFLSLTAALETCLPGLLRTQQYSPATSSKPKSIQPKPIKKENMFIQPRIGCRADLGLQYVYVIRKTNDFEEYDLDQVEHQN